jgi:hypothetical protein
MENTGNSPLHSPSCPPPAPIRALRTHLLSFALFAATAISAQPWAYDFGTEGGTFIPANTSTTTFFPNTPVGGGTYRGRVGTQGGTVALDAPGTSLGSGAEVRLVAATGNSANKVAVYNWSNLTSTAVVKFKLRTTSTGNGTLAFNVGTAVAGYSDNNISGDNNNSLAFVHFNYAGGNLASVIRRDGSTSVPITGGVFQKDAGHEVEVFANNATLPTYYHKDGVNHELAARRWDLWVDGVKISSAGGWPRSGNTTDGTVASIVFYG